MGPAVSSTEELRLLLDPLDATDPLEREAVERGVSCFLAAHGGTFTEYSSFPESSTLT